MLYHVIEEGINGTRRGEPLHFIRWNSQT